MSQQRARVTANEILHVHVNDLEPGRYQPRGRMREDHLAELAASIREQGVLQPLIVRAVDAPSATANMRYEIVAGERRWQAARLVGLTTVPVIVRELTDQAALAVALIENLQREDLNPIDQARSMSRLVEEFGLTHEEIAKALGRSRASITNFLRLLELDDDVKQAVIDGALDMGHARALLPLPPARQAAMAERIERLGWSVRQVERTVKSLLDAPAGAPPAAVVDLQTRWLEKQLAKELGEAISIRPGSGGDYVLKLSFADLAKLAELLQRLQDLVSQIRETAGPRARERVS